MARSHIGHLAILALAGLVLTGCEEGKSPFGAAPAADGSGAAATASSVRLVDRDVEAPEVFQVTDAGLWDGRPSLGGVWVATPEVTDPERVIIRNTENGKFVIGALFRREFDNPGPSIQISSDAAAALGMLAGQPSELNVTALRREEAATETPDAGEPILDTAETVATEALDTAEVAAAIDEAEGIAPAAEGEAVAVAVETDAAGDTVVAAEAVVDGEVAEVVEEVPAPKKKKRWWQRNKEPEVVEVLPEGEAAAAAGLAADAAVEGAEVAAVATAEIATAPLEAAPAAPAAPGKSLIQLGIFSVEENAQRAADMVIKAGAPATVRTERSNGKIFWSVVAGPANTPADREALMKTVKDLGFTDAYFVSR